MAAFDFDVVVIGAGIAGLSSGVAAAGLGKRVAIVERRFFGGNCGALACLPSKMLVRAGHVSGLFARLEDFGLARTPSGAVDNQDLMAHVRSVVQRVKEKDSPATFGTLGIEIVTGSAEFINSHSVSVGRRRISSSAFVVATGTRPSIPDLPGLASVDYLTNETLYDLERLPHSLIILGGGVDGLEIASALRRLGVDVTVVEMAARLLGNEDAELVNMLFRRLRQEGTRLLAGTRVQSLTKEGDQVALSVVGPSGDRLSLRADRVLLTIGRKANLEDLKLENAGIAYNARGIATDRTMRTSARNVYACGDIAGPYQIASMAEYQGIIAGANAVLPFKRKADYGNAAFGIFTEPNLARVGLTEQEAHQKYGESIQVYRFNYAQMRRAMVDGNDTGMAKIVCDKRWRVLGAHLLGEAATELIHELQMARALRLPLHRLSTVARTYPSYSQAITGRASQLAYLDRMGSSLFVRRFLAAAPGYRNNLRAARDRLAETQRPSNPDGTGPGNKAEVRRMDLASGVVTLEMPRKLDGYDERPYLDASASSSAGRPGFLLLDFKSMQRMNGLGASMLVKLVRLANLRRQEVLATGLSEHHRAVFDLVGLGRAMRICRDLTEAAILAGFTATEASPSVMAATDTSCWAAPVKRLVQPGVPHQAINMNVKGRRVVGPVDGFGPLWQKRYRLSISGVDMTPEEVMVVLKQNFSTFQPGYNRFYMGAKGVAPGDVVAIDSSTPGGPVSTGVMVLYADDESFTFVTPQGHPESGWVTFSAFRSANDVVVQILGLARANDPVYEVAFRAIGSAMQIRIWSHVLSALAMHLGVPADVRVQATCVDPAVQWRQLGNVWYNAQIRTMVAAPAWLLARSVKVGRENRK
jgi:pyruvate/2-oxoglutarate dehydrogenase complex dihydrolipoamide dehydrogenase (E3) component/anti-anti-sigma regulatory factor